MYCSTCGTQIAEGLNFCSRCGNPTDRTAAHDGDNRLSRMLIITGAIIAVCGLAGLIPLLRTLIESRLPEPAVGMITLIYLAVLAIMFSVTMVMAWKMAGAPSGKKARPQQGTAEEYRGPGALPGISTAQLYEGGIPSVVENTTRTLDEVPVARR